MSMPTKTEIRKLEADWLVEAMRSAMMNNTRLFLKLQDAGFDGKINNLTMWKGGHTPIPNEWIVPICQALFPHTWRLEATNFVARRFPGFEPLLTVDAPPLSREEATKPKPSATTIESISYKASRGAYAGDRYEPAVNKFGQYIVSPDRYAANQLYFDSLDDVVDALRRDSDLKIRMRPVAGGPASLIKQDSLEITRTNSD